MLLALHLLQLGISGAQERLNLLKFVLGGNYQSVLNTRDREEEFKSQKVNEKSRFRGDFFLLKSKLSTDSQ